MIGLCYIKSGIPNGAVGSSVLVAPLGVVAQNNLFFRADSSTISSLTTLGGVKPVGTIFNEANSGFTDFANGDFTLATNSPSIDAGPPDPQYNDRDGSRNDIGMFGGHNFIPDGRTTNKPIVLGLDIAPIAVPTGGTVTIESTGATLK